MKIKYKWFASYFDTALFTCSATISNNLQQSKMAHCSKEQKRAVRRSRLFQRCFLNFEKSSFLMKTMLLERIHKLGVACKEYDRNPRRVCRERSMDWCDHHMLQMEDAVLLVALLMFFSTAKPFC